jgi:hypothetical protein
MFDEGLMRIHGAEFGPMAAGVLRVIELSTRLNVPPVALGAGQ